MLSECVTVSGTNSPASNYATEKARRAVVLRRQHGTTRSRRLADQSCCRDAILEASWQKSIRYCKTAIKQIRVFVLLQASAQLQ